IGYVDKILLNNKQEEEMFQYRITAVQIKDLEDKFDDTITPEDLEEINQMSLDNPIEKLKDSIAPNIWGRDDLKKILLLQMVGGVQKEMNDGKLTRDWINLLVVGSPSTSKTELAKNVNIRCPKSFYASGDNASGVGLTVAMAKDELLGNWGIEVGPLVKANRSLLVCDELDKFPKEQLKALHTPLESGIVKLSKAGVDGKFPAETAMLGLANPKYGVFDENKSIIEQVNLPPALLSRFDLIYVLHDEINKESDDKITELIYSQTKKLSEEPISVQLFRKYISHAKNFQPKLLEKHLRDLQEFYHDVRKKSISKDSKMKGLPIGTRHLQGLIRFAEASAKLRLSDTVEKEDFELAKKLFYDSLVKIGLDEGGVFDMARITNNNQTVSRRKKNDFVLDTLRTLCAEWGTIKDYELRQVILEKGMDDEDFERTIEQLNREGYILKNGNEWRIV
ncbi:MAG: ATP-binding protein, partial [Candidatus Woesearchaeota archaeon]